MRYLILLIVIVLATGTVAILNRREISDAVTLIKAVKIVKSESRKNDGYLFLGTDGRTQGTIFSHFFPPLRCESLVLPSRRNPLPPLDLGDNFFFYQKKNPQQSTIGDIKELFLRTDRVWVFKERNFTAHTSKEVEQALRWIKLVTDETNIRLIDNKFVISLHRFKSGITYDGMLLDLFLNDLNDPEKAVMLIKDEGFRPEMLGGYFYDLAPNKIEGAVRKLLEVCPKSDKACHHIVLEKIQNFEKHNARD